MRIEHLLDRATAASQGGRREEARDLLVDVLAADPVNLEAWLRLAELAASPERAALYYQRASDIDPRSLRAQKGLEAALAILGPAQEPMKPSQVVQAGCVPPTRTDDPPPARAAGGVPAASPELPIFVDNEATPFALEMGPGPRASSASPTSSSRYDAEEARAADWTPGSDD